MPPPTWLVLRFLRSAILLVFQLAICQEPSHAFYLGILAGLVQKIRSFCLVSGHQAERNAKRNGPSGM